MAKLRMSLSFSPELGFAVAVGGPDCECDAAQMSHWRVGSDGAIALWGGNVTDVLRFDITVDVPDEDSAVAAEVVAE